MRRTIAECSGSKTWSGLRSYPKVTAKVVCIGLDFAAEQERVEARYPSFRSTPTEREALFGALSLSLGRSARLPKRQPHGPTCSGKCTTT